jgi:predicted transcriptional regulator
MLTTLALDDEIVAKVQAFTGLKEKSSLVREALKALIERESARRLARLGGSEPAAAGSLLILAGDEQQDRAIQQPELCTGEPSRRHGGKRERSGRN